ncbi:MAG: NAD-dependent epimerase/dehydratase family protein [Pseudobdellovibrio sp.]
MKILITGGSGMLGRNVVAALSGEAYQVFAPARSELDLFNREGVRLYIRKLQPEIVIHAASRVGGILANFQDPIGFMTENLELNTNLLLVAHEEGVPRLINICSSCVYPKNASEPISEEAVLTGELEPTNEGYTLAKIAALRLCKYINQKRGVMSFKSLIACNLFGYYDKYDLHDSHMIPAAIRKIHEAKISGSQQVEIWGDGKARREFMFAEDFANCIVSAVKNFETVPEAMNVGPGKDLSVLEYYTRIAAIVGYKGEFTFNLAQPVGVASKLMNGQKLNHWGWNKFTPIDESLALTYQFYLKDKSR